MPVTHGATINSLHCMFTKKQLLFVVVGLIWSLTSSAQSENLVGEVSFISSRNVYVKFSSTATINIGDTLYIELDLGAYQPALVVSNKSSTSVVTTPLEENNFKRGDRVIFKMPMLPVVQEDPEKNVIISAPEVPLVITPEEDKDTLIRRVKQGLSGRVSVASYSNINQGNDSHRFRYQFNVQANRIKNTGLSFDSYVVFRHEAGAWGEVQENLSDALKIYNLSALYDINSSSRISFGRRINPRFSNMGAVDGLQFEKEWGRFLVGVIAGSRPDFEDYGINPSLFEYGLFAGINARPGALPSMTTLAFVQQNNAGNVDRQFVFLQHSGNLHEDVFFLTSFEIDLYEKIAELVSHEPQLTNFFASARWRASRKLSISGSYDNRKNIIFYESYKNYIDQLIDNETRQGLRFGVNVQPLRRISLSGNFNWRFQASGQNDAKNISGQLRFSNPWGRGSSVSLRTNWLQTDFMSSELMGMRISQSLLNNLLGVDLYARRVVYRYENTGLNREQYLGGLNLDVRLTQTLGLYLFGEGTLNNDNSLSWLFNTRIVKRIK